MPPAMHACMHHACLFFLLFFYGSRRHIHTYIHKYIIPDLQKKELPKYEGNNFFFLLRKGADLFSVLFYIVMKTVNW